MGKKEVIAQMSATERELGNAWGGGGGEVQKTATRRSEEKM